MRYLPASKISFKFDIILQFFLLNQVVFLKGPVKSNEKSITSHCANNSTPNFSKNTTSMEDKCFYYKIAHIKILTRSENFTDWSFNDYFNIF